ncbi:MAG: hypothetical protein KQ78_01784 [Candidatus Izimaplasma bacterium HR2]|nr:MAG: hypothetical protein KQ78_01784 [Candidatus Izimaplasma bacterium HR2]
MLYFKDEFKKEFPNIPFNLIDEEMHDLIYMLNKIGLKTQFCCQGHQKTEPSVMFAEEVTDAQIKEFMCHLPNIVKIGSFYK